jgi:hypothetical protein
VNVAQSALEPTFVIFAHISNVVPLASIVASVSNAAIEDIVSSFNTTLFVHQTFLTEYVAATPADVQIFAVKSLNVAFNNSH